MVMNASTGKFQFVADPGAANKEKADLQTALSAARFEIERLQAELRACDDTERLNQVGYNIGMIDGRCDVTHIRYLSAPVALAVATL